MSLSRRELLISSTLAGAAFVLRCRRSDDAEAGGRQPLSFWLAVHPDGAVELRLSKLEMGQGSWTVLAVLAAEELAVDPSELRRVEMSTDDLREVPAFEARARPDNLLEAGSSLGVTLSWLPVRTAAAAAREMLIAAAAAKWRVPVTECRVRAGRVEHTSSGRAAHYGELAADAALLPVPAAPRLTPRAELVHIGRPTRRVDGRDVVTAKARFGCDVRLPDQLYAALARPPLGATGAPRFDPAAARAVPGVTGVFPVERAVAVVGETSWAALQGRDRLAAAWDTGDSPRISSAAFERELERALDAPAADRYDPRSAVVGAVEVASRGRAPAWSDAEVEARYATPFQAHATMEPPNALVRFDGAGRCEVWTGTQWPQRTRRAIARKFALDMDRIVIYPQRLGGSFGRKEAPDFVLEAVAVGRELNGTPVQLLWSRADDLGHDHYHPPSRHRLAARLRDGRITAWRHRVASPSIEKQWELLGRKPWLIPRFESAGAWEQPYGAADLLVEYVDLPCPYPLGFWRGIEIVSNVFAVESFVDELARAAKRDALDFRLQNLAGAVTDAPPFAISRLGAVLKLAAERAGWGSPLPAGRGRGLAGLVFDGRSACATVAEVTVTGGAFRVDRLVCAIDCGTVVNPLGLAGNVESALVWGLSALESEITFVDGRAEQTSHLDYPILRLPQMPAVEVIQAPSDEPPSGAGEIPVPTVAPAVANAIFDACGQRLRRLPFRIEERA